MAVAHQAEVRDAKVHPTAIVDSRAALAPGVEIGPYSVIGPHVRLMEGVQVGPHVVIDGRTRIGPNTRIFPFASIGHIPQDLKYGGEPSELVIGASNTIREHVTMNPGTKGGGMVTRVGDNCLFMVGVHIAHDCKVGDHVVMANNATLAGHVEVGDWALLAGLNIVGLKRRGFTREQVHALRTAYRLLFAQEGTMTERLSDVEEIYHDNEVVMEIVAFIRADSSRAICQPRPGDVE